jgi:hypothetical protein
MIFEIGKGLSKSSMKKQIEVICQNMYVMLILVFYNNSDKCGSSPTWLSAKRIDDLPLTLRYLKG